MAYRAVYIFIDSAVKLRIEKYATRRAVKTECKGDAGHRGNNARVFITTNNRLRELSAAICFVDGVGTFLASYHSPHPFAPLTTPPHATLSRGEYLFCARFTPLRTSTRFFVFRRIFYSLSDTHTRARALQNRVRRRKYIRNVSLKHLA